jgi:hypothetical protein
LSFERFFFMSQFRRNASDAHSMLGGEGTITRVPALATVYQSERDSTDWCVGSLDSSGEGSIFTTVFLGPFARERALEYAREKYSGFQVREPDRS